MQTIIEPKDFADRLYMLRCKERMSRKALAAAVGVSVNTIRAWEDGLSEPKAGSVVRVLQALKCGAKELFENCQSS